MNLANIFFLLQVVAVMEELLEEAGLGFKRNQATKVVCSRGMESTWHGSFGNEVVGTQTPSLVTRVNVLALLRTTL